MAFLCQIHCRVHENLLLGPTLSQLNSVHILTFYIKIHFNIILSTPRSHSWLLLSRTWVTFLSISHLHLHIVSRSRMRGCVHPLPHGVVLNKVSTGTTTPLLSLLCVLEAPPMAFFVVWSPEQAIRRSVQTVEVSFSELCTASHYFLFFSRCLGSCLDCEFKVYTYMKQHM